MDELKEKFLYTEDTDALAAKLGTIVQRGTYALTANVQFIEFPVHYLSAADNNHLNLNIQLTSKTTNPAFVESVIGVSALGTVNISAISGFTVSGSGTDTGYWLALGYK